MELVRSSFSIASGLPRVTVRSAPAITFSGPAQRSLTLRPARSRSRLATLYIESSDSLVASAADSIASGWSEPVPGPELHPLKSSAFHGALLRQIAVFTLRLDWSFPGLDYWGIKSLDCTLGGADKRPFCDVASVTAPYRPLDGRLVARASTVATAFRLRGCFFLWHPSPEYDSPQSHFRFGSPLLENHCRDQCEAC